MLRGNNGGSGTPGRVVFKKYAKNRRLYDTSAKKYVNLDELKTMIRNGVDVQVLDADTGEDITRVCLMQIVMEDTKEKPTGVPLELLRQLIVASDHVGREFIMWYLQSAFDTYRKVQGAMESGLSEVQNVASSPLQMVRNFIQSAAAPKSPQPEPPVANEMDELRKRIAELEKLVETKTEPKPRKPRKARAQKSR